MNDHAVFLGKIVRKLQKYIDKILKSPLEPKHPWVKGTQVLTNKRPFHFQKEIMIFFLLINIIIMVL